MTDIFLGFLNRSLAAGILILAVVLVRLVFKKAPRWLLCALWALAAVRLVCPVSIESVLSLIPSAEPVQPEIIVSAQPAITSGIPAVDAIVNPPLAAAFTPSPAQSANPLQIWTFLAACVWLAGIAALLLYAAVSALRLRLRPKRRRRRSRRRLRHTAAAGRYRPEAPEGAASLRGLPSAAKTGRRTAP